MDISSPLELRETLPQPDEYFALFESTGWNEEYRLDAAQLHAAASRSWRIVSAYENGLLAGSGRILSDGVFHALIVDMIVLPTHQGRGIGTAILQRLLQHCREGGIRDVQLFCARGKAGFYNQSGFEARPAEAPGMEQRLP
jgi:GNAT superfamily N-acetyltransferase